MGTQRENDTPVENQSEAELANDYMRWLVVLTIWTVLGCVAAVGLLYFLVPEWFDKMYF